MWRRIARGKGSDMDELWLVRHGETEWSANGRHTGDTDIPLTDHGEEVAAELKSRLAGESFALVLSSPRQRARRTAELAGFADAELDEDLAEWGYGDYEGVTTDEIHEHDPGWSVWTGHTPGGEPAEDVSKRLDRVLAKAAATSGRVLVFGHGHALRGLAARWIQQPVTDGRFFKLDTATVSVLGYERDVPVVQRWNA